MVHSLETMTERLAWFLRTPPLYRSIIASPCSISSHTWPRWPRRRPAMTWTRTRWDRSSDHCWYGRAPHLLGTVKPLAFEGNMKVESLNSSNWEFPLTFVKLSFDLPIPRLSLDEEFAGLVVEKLLIERTSEQDLTPPGKFYYRTDLFMC